MSEMTRPLFGAEQEKVTSNDYYTPEWIFNQMGIEFDIDVASPPDGVPWIPAKRYYSMADDGLSAQWEGRVWMNPPFSESGLWVARFIEHGHGIALLPFAKSKWFGSIWDAANAIVPIDNGGGKMEMTFFREGKFVNIMYPCFLAAFGPECVDAVGRIGKVR